MSLASPSESDLAAAFARLYAERYGARPCDVRPFPADASQRRMARLTGPDGATVVAVHGPEPAENRAFWSFSRTLRGLGLPVPAIHAVDEPAGLWLEEDLGDRTLLDEIETGRRTTAERFPDLALRAYEKVIDLLPRFQVEGGRAIDFSLAYPRATFDAQAMSWDLYQFKYHFLLLARIPFHEDRLERDFQRLVADLAMAPPDHFVYRDLQSRNVMMRDGEPWFLDYQGGRRGALPYDVASLLHDAKAGLPEDVREVLLCRYLSALRARLPAADEDGFRRHYRGFVLLRTLQALGTYGLRGWHERKVRFLRRIAPRVEDVERFLATGFVPLDLPELRTVLERVCAEERFRPRPTPPSPTLTVHVGSFAWRTGYPPPRGAHGGGTTFDCRGLPNPGRDPALELSTGLEEDVRRMLEGDPAVEAFFAGASRVVAVQVEDFRRRRLAEMEVHFGCTGGRHRSVYLAARLGAWLRGAYPDLDVRVAHAEEPTWGRGTPPPGGG